LQCLSAALGCSYAIIFTFEFCLKKLYIGDKIVYYKYARAHINLFITCLTACLLFAGILLWLSVLTCSPHSLPQVFFLYHLSWQRLLLLLPVYFSVLHAPLYF